MSLCACLSREPLPWGVVIVYIQYRETEQMSLFSTSSEMESIQSLNLFIFDADDSLSYWKIPAAGAYNWVAFDLGSEYTLTGVRIAGWYV